MSANVEQFKPGEAGRPFHGVVARNTLLDTEVQCVAIDGFVVLEGDIILGRVKEMERLAGGIQPPGIVAKDRYRWPDGVIPYHIDSSLPDQGRVTQAIRHWENRTNICFRARSRHDFDFIMSQPSDGCSSYVGRQGGRQAINLSAGCTTGNVIHEIGHAVGLWHEHSREDRDDFVQIVWDNIQRSYRHNFIQRIKSGDDSGPYDYASIMHYPTHTPDFAIHSSQPTIIAPQPIGQRNGLSAGDIATANAFYPHWTDNVRISGQTSKATPAMGAYGGLLHVLHLGSSSNTIWHTTYDGTHWTPNVEIPGQSSKATPAMAVYDGRLHMLHLGNRANTIWHSIYDGRNWSPNVQVPGQTSRSAPVMAVLGGRLHMLHLGNDSNTIWHSIFDGRNWSRNVRIPGQTSQASPALAAFNGRLHMLHLGNDSHAIWHSVYDGRQWTANVRIRGQSSKSRPALAAYDDSLHMVHLGSSANDIWHSVFDGREWRPNVRIRGQSSKTAPALAVYEGRLHMLHLGSSTNDIWHSWYI